MFDNLTMEIFYYSLIPVVVIALFALIVLLFGRKKLGDVKYNYIIKISLIVIISLVLPLIIGYTGWVFSRYSAKGTLASNIGYIIILGTLIITLITLLSIICRKLFLSFNHKKGVSL